MNFIGERTCVNVLSRFRLERYYSPCQFECGLSLRLVKQVIISICYHSCLIVIFCPDFFDVAFLATPAKDCPAYCNPTSHNVLLIHVCLLVFPNEIHKIPSVLPSQCGLHSLRSPHLWVSPILVGLSYIIADIYRRDQCLFVKFSLNSSGSN